MPFRIASKECTILKNKCKTYMLKNYNISLKEINNLNKRKDILCLWIGRISIIKMAILFKFVYTFDTVPIKIPADLFVGIVKQILKSSIAYTEIKSE